MHPKKSGSPSGKKHKVSNTVKTLEALKESPPSSSPLKTPASKKRTASSSPVSDYKEFKKLDTMSSNEKLMSALKSEIAELKSALSSESKANTSELAAQIGNVTSDIDELRQDVRALDVRIESRVAAVEDRQDLSDARQDRFEKKFETFQETVKEDFLALKKLVETGTATPLSRSSMSFDELHERDLLHQLNEAQSMVTVVNVNKQSLSPNELGAILTLQGFLQKGDHKTILSVIRMGGARTANPAFKVKLESSNLAQVLIEKSRSSSGSADEEASIRIYPFVSTPYAAKHRIFRDMASAMMSLGYMTRIEYEGTCMVLKAKERTPGGVWCIVQGGTFRPPTTGRELATENEDPVVAFAREKMTGLLTSDSPQSLVNSIKLMTKDSLVDADSIFEKLGAEARDDYVKYTEVPVASGNKKHYRIYYKTRIAAKAALDSTLNSAPNSKNLDPSDIVKMSLPWVVEPTSKPAAPLSTEQQPAL